ncbi:hypothetical protein [Myroides fluvii]|uniref:hypothetical protein n=1 Tax=Myroides fluvii TaxID=2572594 RepID=UPI00131D15BA|nr:hypothetical protein [Myroides fluvii]
MKTIPLFLFVYLSFTVSYSQTTDYCLDLKKQLHLNSSSEGEFLNLVNKNKKYCLNQWSKELLDSIIAVRSYNFEPLVIIPYYREKTEYERFIEGYTFKSDELYSFIDERKEQLKELGYSTISFNYDYYYAGKDGIYTLFDSELKPLITDLQGVNWLYSKLYFDVEEISHYAVIRKEGKTAIFDLKASKIVGNIFADRNYMPIIANKKIVFFHLDKQLVDLEGNLFIENQNSSRTVRNVDVFPEVQLILYEEVRNKMYLINFKKEVVSKTYDGIYPYFSNGHGFEAIKDGKKYVLNRFGKEIKQLEVDEELKVYLGKYFIYKKGGLQGIVDEDLKLVVPLVYTAIKYEEITETFWCKTEKGKIVVLDFDLNQMMTFQKDSAAIVYDNKRREIYYINKQGKQYGVVDLLGRAKTPTFDTLEELRANTDFLDVVEMFK